MFNFIDYYQGIGSPRPFLYHQILIQNTCTNLNFECRPRGLYAYAEATVTEDYNDLAPDISIYTAGENPRAGHEELRPLLPTAPQPGHER